MVVKTLSSFTKEDSIFLSNQRFDQDKTQNLFSRQITLNKILVYNFLLRADQRQKKNFVLLTERKPNSNFALVYF